MYGNARLDMIADNRSLNELELIVGNTKEKTVKNLDEREYCEKFSFHRLNGTR